MSDTIRAWSFSALSLFETCPLHAKYSKVDKVPELPRPSAPSGEHANDRGTRIHENMEHHVRNNVSLVRELKTFAPDIQALKHFHDKGQAELENMWCFNQDWQPVHEQDYQNIWLRVKLDAFVLLEKERGVVIDLKTGKRFGNEVKHAQQIQLYALAAFFRYPDLERTVVELWYPDVDELVSTIYSRNQAMKFFSSFNERALKMTSTTDFIPKANINACRFCPYGPKEASNKWVNKSGHCPHGV